MEDGIVHTNNSHRELYAWCCCFTVIYCFCPMFLFGENLLASSKKLRRRKQVAGTCRSDVVIGLLENQYAYTIIFH